MEVLMGVGMVRVRRTGRRDPVAQHLDTGGWIGGPKRGASKSR